MSVVLHITAETGGIASHYVFMNAKYFSVDFFSSYFHSTLEIFENFRMLRYASVII